MKVIHGGILDYNYVYQLNVFFFHYHQSMPKHMYTFLEVVTLSTVIVGKIVFKFTSVCPACFLGTGFYGQCTAFVTPWLSLLVLGD